MKFKFDASKLLKGLVEREVKARAAVGLYADTLAKQMEAYAKANRVWNDITGQARGTLKGSWKWQGDVARVELSHGVYYGVYLELCNERRYAIIRPTIYYLAPKAVKGLANILK